MWVRIKPVVTTAVFAVGTLAASLGVLWPRTTHADLTEISAAERQGDYDEEGMKFGNIVVKGELVADAKAPGGWALVRTFENKADVAESCTLEERILRTETMPDARANPPSTAMLTRTQRIALGPHEKKRIGVYLPPALGAQMTEGHKSKASLEQRRALAMAQERYDLLNDDRTYMMFDVDYLRPLEPGTVAAKEDNGVRRPARLDELVPPSRDMVGAL